MSRPMRHGRRNGACKCCGESWAAARSTENADWREDEDLDFGALLADARIDDYDPPQDEAFNVNSKAYPVDIDFAGIRTEPVNRIPNE
jgi:hypothetical protein